MVRHYYIVEIEVPLGGLGRRVDDMHQFHHQRGIKNQRGPRRRDDKHEGGCTLLGFAALLPPVPCLNLFLGCGQIALFDRRSILDHSLSQIAGWDERHVFGHRHCVQAVRFMSALQRGLPL
jgi:hypothetical protein